MGDARPEDLGLEGPPPTDAAQAAQQRTRRGLATPALRQRLLTNYFGRSALAANTMPAALHLIQTSVQRTEGDGEGEGEGEGEGAGAGAGEEKGRGRGWGRPG